MNKPALLYIASYLFTILLSGCSSESTKTPVDYVNPYMGNISHLLVPTYPTVHLPNSMLRVYPERANYTSELIKGLPIAVTSHRGSSVFNLNPFQGNESDACSEVYYSYDQEKITPYRYTVFLDKNKINVDYAPSHRSAIYTIQFEESRKEANFILLNVGNGKLTFNEEGHIEGYQIIDNSQTKIYLYLETEQKPHSTGFLSGTSVYYGASSINGENKSAVLKYNKETQTINIRYGISFISSEQAKRNLRKEIRTFDVNQVAEKGKDIWNKALSSISVKGGNENDKIVFYTSLYRVYERMINISEEGKYYSAFDHQIHNDEGIPFYTDDWIWDTYRAVHPLRILIDPEAEQAMIHSYLRMAEQSPEFWLPTFPEITGDSHRMNGNHGVIVLWDAYIKGLTNFDLETAYKTSKGALTEKTLLPWQKAPYTELDTFYRTKGYYPALHPDQEETVAQVSPTEKRQAVAVTLGTCYDDWCLSQIAKKLNFDDDYNYFLNASYNYRNLFNEETSFFHPKDKNGNFIMPFDYRYAGGQGGREYYDENNGWIYRWDVAHRISDLITLMGGKEQFIRNLDDLFTEPLGMEKFLFYHQFPDHTGNVGQFSMANEPSLHIPYLYNYAGKPWMTQKRIRQLLKQWFRNDLMGAPGDEDGGGLSAFVVFSSMGFYPVTPGIPVYNIGSPLFQSIKIDLKNGKTFEIEALNNSEENKYIQSATLNGKKWNKPWFSHDEIKNGGKLILIMGNRANPEWGSSPESVPPSGE